MYQREHDRMKILITSAARKVWLVKAFQATGAHVTACDLDPLAPSLRVADSCVVQPPDIDYFAFLIKYCKQNKIDAIVPTRTGELFEISRLSTHLFHGTTAIISQQDPIFNCINKLAFKKVCQFNNLPTPQTLAYKKYFGKPIEGAGSEGAFTIDGENNIIQEFIDWPEYTIDVFITPDHRAISAVPRLRIKTVNGESWTGRTVNNKNLIDAGIDICQKFGLIWQNTVQCFYDGLDIKIIEINPRFGGGCALSIAAGANSPQWIVDILSGKTVKQCIGEFKPELTMSKFTTEVYF